jgi:diaminopimelate dehydrogenase
MKVNIGIVGYGNLGKAVEQTVLSNANLNLIAIFSRRTVTSKFDTKIEPYEAYKNYIGKIHIMLLCGGSKSDLEIQTPEIARYFDTINTFDTHKKIPSELKKLNEICKENGHVSIMSCGWDPGIFSIIRGLFSAISKNEPKTFWGRGISMGHSDAIRRVPKVEGGIEFTVPNKAAVRLAKLGKLPDSTPMHFRECYVVAEKKDQPQIEYEIKNIPNYFKGQPTTVNFVSDIELLKLKSKMIHKGEIIETFKTVHGSKCKMNFSVYMDSNPNFTATIMTTYINAIINMKENKMTGAFTALDIPISFLYSSSNREKLIKTLC